MMASARFGNIRTICRKELRGFVDGPTFYVATAIFLLLWEYLFFHNVFLVGENSLRSMFDLLPWLFLLLLPAVTMGTMSRELSDGTLEFLLTHPVSDAELVTAKFLSAWAYVGVVLSFVFPIAFEFSRHGTLDWGIVISQYLASLGMAGVFIALGIFVSSMFRSQVSALLVIATGCLLLILVGSGIVTDRAPLSLSPIMSDLSTLTHFQSMERGVIDTRDVWYFLSAILAFLSLAYLQLARRRFGNRKSIYRSYRIGVLMLIAIAILTNVVGSRIPGRVDMTRAGQYTLSAGTRQLIGHLGDVVNVTLYASDQLPSQLQPVLRDVKDTLDDYRTLGHGNIVVKVKNPASSKVADEARSRGVQETQFNTVGQEEFKVKKGFFGIAISSGGQTKAIPLIQDTNNLEYQLTSLISQLTNSRKKTVAFLTGHDEKSSSTDFAALSKELEKQFDVTSASLDSTHTSIPSNTDVLIIAGPTKKMDSSSSDAIAKYLDHGGAALVMVDGMTLDEKTLQGTANASGATDLLKPVGVTINKDVVFDLRANTTTGFSTGQSSFFVPYAFWPQPTVSKSSQITQGLEGVTLPWPSSISVDQNQIDSKHLKVTTLLESTEDGGAQSGPYNLNPQQQPSASNLGKKVMAVSIEGAKGHTGDAPHVVVVGDSRFATDQFLQRSQASGIFALQAMSWLAQEPSLASIQTKSAVMHKLKFDGSSGQAFVKYLNLVLALLVPAGIGGYRFWRRRRLSRRTYRSAA